MLSSAEQREAAATLGPQAEICEFCGLPIEEESQTCPALDDGRCRP